MFCVRVNSFIMLISDDGRVMKDANRNAKWVLCACEPSHEKGFAES